MVSRTRFACLLPALVIFIALRALSHAHPVPLPWSSGLFDAQGLDDILQTIRIPCARSDDVRHVMPRVLAAPTGRVVMSEPSVARGASLAAGRSRAPPSS